MPSYVSDGAPFISSENFSEGDGVNFKKGKKVSDETVRDQNARFRIEKGDFAFSRIGTIGKTRFLPTDTDYGLSHALVVIKARSESINRRFLRYAMSSSTVLHQARSGVQSVGVPDLGMGKIRAFAVPLMDVREQCVIADEVERRLSVVDKLEQTVEENLRQAEGLRQSILKRAFSGELVPQDPEDEPASVLLERIREERETTKQTTGKRRKRKSTTASSTHAEQGGLF